MEDRKKYEGEKMKTKMKLIILMMLVMMPLVIASNNRGTSLSCEKWIAKNNVVTLQNVGGINGPIMVYHSSKLPNDYGLFVYDRVITKIVSLGRGCSITMIPRIEATCTWTSDSTYCQQKFKCESPAYPKLNYFGKRYKNVCDTGMTYSATTKQCENPLAWSVDLCIVCKSGYYSPVTGKCEED